MCPRVCVCVLLNVSSPPKPQHGARHDVGCLLSVRDCEMLFFVSFLFWWFFSRFALQHHPAPSTIASYRCQATPAPALLFMLIPLVVWDCCVSFFFIPISHDALVVVSGGCASGDSLHSSYQGECCVCFFLFFPTSLFQWTPYTTVYLEIGRWIYYDPVKHCSHITTPGRLPSPSPTLLPTTDQSPVMCAPFTTCIMLPGNRLMDAIAIEINSVQKALKRERDMYANFGWIVFLFVCLQCLLLWVKSTETEQQQSP